MVKSLAAIFVSILALTGFSQPQNPLSSPAFLVNFLPQYGQWWPTNLPNLQVWITTSTNVVSSDGSTTPPPNGGTIGKWYDVLGTPTYYAQDANATTTYLSAGGPDSKPALMGVNGNAFRGLYMSPLPHGSVTNWTAYLIIRPSQASTGNSPILDFTDSGSSGGEATPVMINRLDLMAHYYGEGSITNGTGQVFFPTWTDWTHWYYMTFGAYTNGTTNCTSFFRTNGVLCVSSNRFYYAADPPHINRIVMNTDRRDNCCCSTNLVTELIVYSGVQSTNDIQTVEAYLARRIAGTQ